MLFKSIDKIPSFTAGDFTTIQEVLHPKNDGIQLPYSLAHAKLEVGERSYAHILRHQSELYFVLKGVGMAFVGGEIQEIKVGDMVLIEQGEEQYVENIGTGILSFLCIVSPPWSAEDEVIVE